MASRNKLQKFAEIVSFPNVYENYDPKNPGLVGVNQEPIDLKGKWNELHFKNDQPIVLELACGRGEYSLGLGTMYPNRNFIGVDVKGARIWRGARTALDENLTNVAFLRTRIEQINLFFEKDEVDEIWITFPDPFLKDSKENRRLTSPNFLKRFRDFLKKDGVINLKTDSPELYAYTREILSTEPGVEVLYDKDDIYKDPLDFPELDIKTYYERSHLLDGRLIKFIRFRFKDEA
ncbi:tRNA (guanosine(46)-N7)-methyltransferase TrmB [Portibacter lacus]|uniref:tRNA (guanine-N(7)-)-methyltransferase n=1 Tax=Portibacter lacus TaxID=1099794 RepID=A0AA37SQS1_9BACT|nr:tRNA (guanosine(46)-N7)-methyltransferase TrmB [Portibacter lacus]GLR18085.1 tRNA (guanine-N(7)-)-methyltransferase [Portibacter lacus]